MMIMISPEKLRRFPFFAGLDDVALKTLAMESAEVKIAANGWVFHEDDDADALYVILSGGIELNVALGMASTHCADLCSLVEGDVFGCTALMEPHTYRTGAVATMDTRLAKLDNATLRKLMEGDPEIGYKLTSRLLQIVGERLTVLRTCFASLVEGDRWQRLESQRPTRSIN